MREIEACGWFHLCQMRMSKLCTHEDGVGAGPIHSDELVAFHLGEFHKRREACAGIAAAVVREDGLEPRIVKDGDPWFGSLHTSG